MKYSMKCYIYIDNILIYTPSSEIHVYYANQVLKCLLEYQHYVKGEKM